ncbi:MAG: hypothetical protein ACM3NQ_18185 [Bacteroidales bacterium]
MNLFLIPPLACIVLIIVNWMLDDRPVVASSIVAVGVACQWMAPMYSRLWVAALVLNAATAVYMSIRLKID